jgi:hypothetical protein
MAYRSKQWLVAQDYQSRKSNNFNTNCTSLHKVKFDRYFAAGDREDNMNTSILEAANLTAASAILARITIK